MKSAPFFRNDPYRVVPLIISLIGLLTYYGCATKTVSGPVKSPRLPQKDTETKAFTKGIQAFHAGQYPEATAHFQSIIDHFPGSPLLMEAQWYLGKSYMATGEKGLAIRELTLFLKNYQESQYGKQARLFISQMELGMTKIIATPWSPDWPLPLKDYLRQINHPGMNTVIMTLPDKQWERIGLLRSPPTASDPLMAWISAARQENLKVLVKIPLRTLKGPMAKNPSWQDMGDPQRRLDLFHPDVKATLLRLARNVAQYPIDGIYVDQITHGIGEGETVSARVLYENLFLEKWRPTEETSPARKQRSYSRQSWRFAGLKSRYITRLLDEMRAAAQAVQPKATFGISVPEILLVDPQDGLVDASLDYVQLKAAQFDFYVITERGVSQEAIYPSLRKYGALEKTWLEASDLLQGDLVSRIPTQGIVVRGR